MEQVEKNKEEKLSEELKRVNDQFDHLHRYVARDIKNPVRLISACCDLLEREHAKSLNDDGKLYLSRITKAADLMDEMIDDLLKFSTIARARNAYEPIDMNKLFQAVTAKLEKEIEENWAEITIGENMPTIYCDRNKLAEAFLQLLDNAIKFSSGRKDQPPAIEVTYEEKDGEHLFSVKDNGIGINRSFHQKVFELFKRTTQAKDFKGTGVGLAIAQNIIEEHGGKIAIKSELEKGAVFTVSLPKAFLENKQETEKAQVNEHFETAHSQEWGYF